MGWADAVVGIVVAVGFFTFMAGPALVAAWGRARVEIERAKRGE